MNQLRPSGFSWGQYGHHNERKDLRDTGQPGHVHNHRKRFTHPDNQYHQTSGRHQQDLDGGSQDPDCNKCAPLSTHWISEETEWTSYYGI